MNSTITAIVLTLNEELNIIDCFKSISLFDRVIVLDSGSSDSTIPLSRELGAEVYIRKPNGTFLFSDQRNWALDNCSINTDWVLFIDADERISKSRYQELRAISNHPSSEHINGFYLAPRYIFFNKWLRFCQHYPNWHPRFLRSSCIRFSGGMWESFVGLDNNKPNSANLGYVKIPYEHIAFSKGFDDWFIKHLRYASWDSKVALDYLESSSDFDSSFISRKSALRVVAIRFWFLRPLLRFCHKYIYSLGFLDGWQGLLFSLLMSFYELLVVIKILEHKYSMASNNE